VAAGDVRESDGAVVWVGCFTAQNAESIVVSREDACCLSEQCGNGKVGAPIESPTASRLLADEIAHMTDIAADMPPNSLYKYRGLDKNRAGGEPYEWDRSIITGCALWAGSPLAFNDPFDCYPVIDFDGTPEEKEAWAAKVAPNNGMTIPVAVEMMENALSDPVTRAKMSEWRENLESVGVLSLTERPDDMLMWAHYANSHHGYCLEMDATIQPFSLAYRVQYAEQRPVFRLFDPDRADIIARTLLHKADFWRHELEWRIVRPANSGPVVFPPQGLKSIIFGAGINNEDETTLREIAAEREIPVTFKRAKLDETNYRVKIVEA
jgi:Protein of unknown function (DUF2971)